MVKVRIDKCDSVHSWYRDQIGSEIFVKDYNDGFYKVEGNHLFLKISDCTVLQDDTEKEERHPSRTDDLYLHIFENYRLSLDDNELNEIIDIAVKYNEMPKLRFEWDMNSEPVNPSPEPVLIAKAGKPKVGEEVILKNSCGSNLIVGEKYTIDGIYGDQYTICGFIFDDYDFVMIAHEEHKSLTQTVSNPNGVGVIPIVNSGKTSAQIKEEYAEKSFYSRYYPLFKHMNSEHGLLLLESEMQEIITIVNEIQSI